MGDFHIIRQGFRENAEAMVLTGNFDFAGGQVFDRLVRAAVAKMHLFRLSAEGEGQHLVAKADAEDRFAAGDQFLDYRNGVSACCSGISWAIGEENAVGFQAKDFFGCCGRRNDGDGAAGGS